MVQYSCKCMRGICENEYIFASKITNTEHHTAHVLWEVWEIFVSYSHTQMLTRLTCLARRRETIIVVRNSVKFTIEIRNNYTHFCSG